MWRPIAKLVRGLVLMLAAIASVFMVGIRTKSPLLLNAVPQDQPRDETARSCCRGGARVPARRPTNPSLVRRRALSVASAVEAPKSRGGAGRGSGVTLPAPRKRGAGPDARAEM
jgi:hypothetical protein